MVMNTRKYPRHNDGYYTRNSPHHAEDQKYKRSSRGHYSQSGRYEECTDRAMSPIINREYNSTDHYRGHHRSRTRSSSRTPRSPSSTRSSVSSFSGEHFTPPELSRSPTTPERKKSKSNLDSRNSHNRSPPRNRYGDIIVTSRSREHKEREKSPESKSHYSNRRGYDEEIYSNPQKNSSNLRNKESSRYRDDRYKSESRAKSQRSHEHDRHDYGYRPKDRSRSRSRNRGESDRLRSNHASKSLRTSHSNIYHSSSGDWIEHVSSSTGKKYYFNKTIGKCQWEKPSDWTLTESDQTATNGISSTNNSNSASENCDEVGNGHNHGNHNSFSSSKKTRDRPSSPHSARDHESRRDRHSRRSDEYSMRKGSNGKYTSHDRSRDRQRDRHEKSDNEECENRFYYQAPSSQQNGTTRKDSSTHRRSRKVLEDRVRSPYSSYHYHSRSPRSVRSLSNERHGDGKDGRTERSHSSKITQSINGKTECNVENDLIREAETAIDTKTMDHEELNQIFFRLTGKMLNTSEMTHDQAVRTLREALALCNKMTTDKSSSDTHFRKHDDPARLISDNHTRRNSGSRVSSPRKCDKHSNYTKASCSRPSDRRVQSSTPDSEILSSTSSVCARDTPLSNTDTDNEDEIAQNMKKGGTGTCKDSLDTTISSVPDFTASLGQYYKPELISHVTGWQTDGFESQSLPIENEECTKISAELKMARSLVRFTEVEATIKQQRVLFVMGLQTCVQEWRPSVNSST